MKTKKIYLKGSFTIEAAVIVPITLMIIVTFVFISLDLHDKVVSRSEAICRMYEEPRAPSGNVMIPKGREQLLRYKVIKDGILSLVGGDDGED